MHLQSEWICIKISQWLTMKQTYWLDSNLLYYRKHRPITAWQNTSNKSTTTKFFFTTSVPVFCRQSMFCTFKRTCCTVSWFGWQFRLSHEDIKHIGSAAKTAFSPVDMSCRSLQLVQLISVVYIGQKNAATKHGDTSSALHKGCCFKSIWSFLGVINK